MTNYLLLRDNKESGPYSIDDLLKIGLKTYDLIWVQGKSAAWRYPSEVDELKPYSPGTEEQPFDRFFKKHTGKDSLQEAPAANQTGLKEIRPREDEKPTSSKPRKSVFVTMPGGQIAKAVNQPAQINPVVPGHTEMSTKPAESTSSLKTAAEVSPALRPEVKYSQPLDDIKDMYLKTLHDRKQKIARKAHWQLLLKKVAVVVLLVALGIIAGFWLRSGRHQPEKVVAQTASQEPSTLQAILPEPPPPTEEKQSPSPAETENGQLQRIKPLQPPSGGYVNEAETNNFPKTANQKNKASQAKTEIPVPGAISMETRPSTTNALTGERSRMIRDTEENAGATSAPPKTNMEKVSASAGLNSLVKVTANDYKRVAFGGIRDLQLTVTNDSRYNLDDVVVELQYLRPNETALKTEQVKFRSIAPGEMSTLRIPDTNRGMKVSYRVVHVNSSQADASLAGMK